MRLFKLIIAGGAFAFGVATAHADVSTKTHDLNGDGVVTFKEVIEFHPASVERTPEFMDRHRGIFDSADTNGDGVVDQSENQGTGAGKTGTKGGKKS
ncbi:MAG: hypothetical protein ABJN26_27950 [Stappiaceae bacterium]